MNLQPENSTACFKRLLSESSSQKFHNSLERVKTACDAIESMEGLMNYSRVARYTENHFGTPKRQSIMNSKRLHLYIDLRKCEYAKKSPKAQKKTAKQQPILYPCADIDLKTKVYIDQLRARNAFLEKTMSNLQEDILRETRKNPINLGKSVAAGVQKNLSMKMVPEHQEENTLRLSEMAKTSIIKLLTLADNPNCALELQIINDEKCFVLETALTQETILFGDELEELRILVGN